MGEDTMTEDAEEATEAPYKAPYNVYQLANMAECAGPDTNTSPGAIWLAMVAYDALELVEGWDRKAQTLEELEDDIPERVDQLVPIYTYEKWQVFVDLAAWTEDISDLGEPEDMDQGASYALYIIAERLIRAIVEDQADRVEDEEEEV